MVNRRRVLDVIASSAIAGAVTGVTGRALDEPGRESTAAVAEGDRLVGAHYYTWYGPDNHWDAGYTGTPALGEYDSTDESVVDQHVEWAADSGIDWFNATWWGPDSYAARALENHVAPAMAGTDVEFSVLYEPKGRFDYADERVDFDERGNRETLAADLDHIASRLVDNPNYFHVDGQPLLYVYIAKTFEGDVQGAFADAQQAAGTEFYLVGDYGWNVQLPSPAFDAVSPYNVYRPVEGINDGFAEWVDETYAVWDQVCEDLDLDFVPLSLPGFDNTEAEWATNGQPVLERSPERYRKICEVARRYMEAAPELVLLTSFNEWHEYTSVEPGEPFGETYLDLTREHLAGGERLSPPRSPVPLRFHWEDFVPESDVNPDTPEGEGRRLTIAVDELRFLDASGRSVATCDVGDGSDLLFAHGVSPPGSHEDRSWRWFTANRTMTSLVLVPSAVASDTAGISVVSRALADDFTFSVTLGDDDAATQLTASEGWGESAATWEGRTTTTRATTTEKATTTEGQPTTAESSTTRAPATATTDSSRSTDASTPGGDSTRTSSDAGSPGFGVGSALAATGLGAYLAGSRWSSAADSDNE